MFGWPRSSPAAGKHILLEKPLDITTERAERLVFAIESAAVTAAVMLQHRFRPSALRLAVALAQGGLGEIIGADPMAFSYAAHRGVWDDFLDAVDAGRAPRITPRDVLQTHYLIEAMLQSAARDGAPIDVSR